MLRNYLKITIRNLLKRKGFALLNVFGLAIGMTCCLLILQYVNFERGYDKFHKDGDRVARLRIDSYKEGKLLWKSATVYPAFGPTMKRDFPEIESFCRLHDAEALLTNEARNVKFNEKKGYFADPAILDVFTIPLVKGNPKTALDAPEKIMLSESYARKYFGNENPIGKPLKVHVMGKERSVEITGVFKDYPTNSHLIIDYLLSYSTLGKIEKEAGDTENLTETAWGWYDFYTYFKLRPGTSIEQIQVKMPAFCQHYIDSKRDPKSNRRTEAYLMPMQDIHLYSNFNQEAEVNGNGQAVSWLFLIAFFILAIAWTNYINLATARSLERAKEVGVRKVMGALRPQLVGQFMMESLLLNFSALLLALLSAKIAMPFFSNFLEQRLDFSFADNFGFWIAMIGVFVLGTTLSGLYPAFVMSGIKPIIVLKGILPKITGGLSMRRTLIVSQFAASITLIVGTIVVYQQIGFMRNQKLGVDIEQTLVLEGASSALFQTSFKPFKNDLMRLSDVQNVTVSSSVPGEEIYWTNGARWTRTPGENNTTMYIMSMDYDFVPTFKTELVAGRTFSEKFGEDQNGRNVLLNESGLKALGISSAEKAINENIILGRDTMKVVGVMADFHHESLKKAVNPMTMRLERGNSRFNSIKLKTENLNKSLADIQRVWVRYFPNDPFNYFFLDQYFDRQYKSDVLFGKVFGFFAMLAILVACLGLLGLSSYNVLQRTKEIGVRKVLGANVSSIVVLLSKDFLKLVVISSLIAFPIAWFVMNYWLQDFASRIEVKWWVFVLAGVSALIIALLTVSYQSIKAALTNPINSLKSE
ncbi:MAG TPA: ABC transporter permease [Runella sp.]|nr:ABC transporter permease [Runella sp.]HAO51259.1 ABC transporter permease [Runella sp.]